MRKIATFALLLALGGGVQAAADYVIDGSGAGMHASVNFKAGHVGISSLWGRFNDVTGRFSYDKDNVEASRIEVVIDPASIDTNHPARDEHLRTSDYLDVQKYPESSFVSTAIEKTGEGEYRITGDFTLHGVTREITIDARRTGEGETVFGDYRVGFEGQARIDLADWGINVMPSSQLDLFLAIEGVRQ
jgi:polyisoprenoid-binding protein YceI